MSDLLEPYLEQPNETDANTRIKRWHSIGKAGLAGLIISEVFAVATNELSNPWAITVVVIGGFVAIGSTILAELEIQRNSGQLE